MNENSTVLIPLDKGQSAIVSASQAHLVQGITWHAGWNHKSATYYAAAMVPDMRPGREGMGRGIQMHRLLCGILDDPSLIVHHRDGNGLNNTIKNMHPCTLFEHGQMWKRRHHDPIAPHIKAGYVSRFRRVTEEELAARRASWPDGIEYGLCQCGCGERTPIAEHTQRSAGMIQGEPWKFCYRHGLRVKPTMKRKRRCKDGNYKPDATPKPKRKRLTLEDYLKAWPKHTPFGHCQCGCGAKTNVTKRGQPYAFIFGHQTKGKPSPRRGMEVIHPGIHPFKFINGSPKYKVNEENGCWDWLGGLDSTGSGITTYGHKKRDRAYVVSWMLHNKQSSVPRGTVIHHICERRICVNPLHLQATTQTANIRASARKLSQSDADAIRAIYAEGKLKMHEIAIAYNIHPAHVSRVVAGKLWESSFASIPSVQDKAVRRRVLKNNKTGFKGVSVKRGRHDWSPIRYVAQVQSSLNGKRILERVGTFHTAIEAARAYDSRVYELFGDRAWLNFPNRPQSHTR